MATPPSDAPNPTVCETLQPVDGGGTTVLHSSSSTLPDATVAAEAVQPPQGIAVGEPNPSMPGGMPPGTVDDDGGVVAIYGLPPPPLGEGDGGVVIVPAPPSPPAPPPNLLPILSALEHDARVRVGSALYGLVIDRVLYRSGEELPRATLLRDELGQVVVEAERVVLLYQGGQFLEVLGPAIVFDPSLVEVSWAKC